MRLIGAIGLLTILAGIGAAQDGPKSVKTLTITGPLPPGMSTLYRVEEDGTVRIDWRAVERLTANQSDGTALPIAQLMLAIRDGTWKPMQ